MEDLGLFILIAFGIGFVGAVLVLLEVLNALV